MELLLDDERDEGVRALWRRLADAGHPSLATHRHPTNRPHLTVVTTESIAGLPPLPLPLEARLGPVRALGRFLVLEVAPTDALRDLHAGVWSAVGGRPSPAQWSPHVSLARRAPEGALAMLAALPVMRGRFVAARSYDTETRTVTGLRSIDALDA